MFAIFANSVSLYLAMEITANWDFVRRIPDWTARKVYGLPAEVQGAWNFRAGIDHSDASAIAGSLAAVVITINVAVFAARLGNVVDLRGEMDLTRWQRVMEILAPVAAVASISVALTRFPDEPSLGINLSLLAGITVGASDVRIARKISALQMEADIAEVQLIQKQAQFSAFLNSLPSRVKKMAPPSHDRGNKAFLITFGSAMAVATLVLALDFSMSDPASLVFARDFGFGTATLTAAAAAAGITALGLLSNRELLRAAELAVAESHGAGRRRRSHHRAWGSLIVVTVPAIISAMWPEQYRPWAAGIAFFAVSVGYLLIQVGARTGKGPGAALVWGMLRRMRQKTEAAEVRAKAVAEERDAEIALHAALDSELRAREAKGIPPCRTLPRVPTVRRRIGTTGYPSAIRDRPE